MAAEEHTDSRHQAVRLNRADIVRTEDGDYLLPVLLGDEDQQIRGHLRIDPDDAARLHAQLERHLNQGWATSEKAKAARYNGETYPATGGGYLRRGEPS